MQLKMKKKKQRNKNMTLQNKSNYTHATQQSHSLFCHFLHFDPTSYIHPLARLLQAQGKDVITGIFALLPQQNRISVSRTTLRRVVYTHRELRRLMPSGLTEKQAQRTAITSRCSFCPRSHCAWCRGSSGKSRVFFLWLYSCKARVCFFHCGPFSHCLRKSLFSLAITFTPFPVARTS